jgi:hypothetical protein
MGNLQEILGWKAAETKRKNGQFAEALDFFRHSYSANPGSESGWRILFCLRKIGRFDEARTEAKPMFEKFPDAGMIRSEIAWLTWSAEISPARQAGDHGAVLQGVQRMLELGVGQEVLEVPVFAGISAARELGLWDQVEALCCRFKPETLKSHARVENGKKLPSRREMWY